MNDKKAYFTQEYLPKVIRIGKITNWIGVLFSFLPIFVISIIYGVVPPLTAIATAFVSGLTTFGILWFVEPISYFPVVGVTGTYMAFLSGNISNMRVPCAAVAQKVANVEPGTEEGTIVSTLGMGTSIFVNIGILTLGVIASNFLLANLSADMTATLNYLLPALFGALFIQFGLKNLKLAPIALAVGLFFAITIKLGVWLWLPGSSNYLSTLGSVFLTIGIAVALHKKGVI